MEVRFTGTGLWLALGLGMASALGASPTRDPDLYEKKCHSYTDEVGSTYEELKTFLEDNKISSARQMVEKWEKHPRYDGFLNSYQLMHTSRSAQRRSVDKDHPRVIFYGRDLLVGVTDHPKRSNENVEVIEYNRQRGEFQFHLIRFGKTGREYVDTPTNCRDCHGKKSLPIWPTYRSWPGAFTNRSHFFLMENPEGAKLTDQQRAERYQRAAELRYKPSPSRTAEEKEFIEETYRLFEPVRRPTEGVYSFLRLEHPREDGAALNGYLNRLNFDRIQRELARSKDFAKYRYAFLGALFRCTDIPEFLGDAEAQARKAHEANWGKTTYADLIQEVRDDMTAGFKKRIDFAKLIEDEEAIKADSMSDEADIGPIAGLRYLFEKRGVDVKRFSYNFHPGEEYGYGFSEIGAGRGGLRFSYCAFLPSAVRADKDLAPLLEATPNGHLTYPIEETSFCGMLKEKSRRVFEAGT